MVWIYSGMYRLNTGQTTAKEFAHIFFFLQYSNEVHSILVNTAVILYAIL